VALFLSSLTVVVEDYCLLALMADICAIILPRSKNSIEY